MWSGYLIGCVLSVTKQKLTPNTPVPEGNHFLPRLTSVAVSSLLKKKKHESQEKPRKKKLHRTEPSTSRKLLDRLAIQTSIYSMGNYLAKCGGSRKDAMPFLM